MSDGSGTAVPLFGGADHMPVTKLSELMSIDKEGLMGEVL